MSSQVIKMTGAEGQWWWTDFCKALPLYDHPLCLHKAVIAKLGGQDRVRNEIEQIRQTLGIRDSIASLRPALCRLLLSAGSLPPLRVQEVRQVSQVLCSSLPTSPASPLVGFSLCTEQQKRYLQILILAIMFHKTC